MPWEEQQEIARGLGAPGVLRGPEAGAPPSEDGGFLWRPAGPVREGRPLPSGIAAVKLTSGSTGAARGILTPAEALVADEDQLARTMGLTGAERILAGVPMSHSYGLASVALPALLRGATVIAPRSAGGPFAAIRAAQRFDVTFMPTVPSYLSALVRLSSAPPMPPSLRLVTTAGAPLSPSVAERFRRTYGRPVRVFYGASEAGGISFDRTGTAGERGTVGTPVEGVSVELAPIAGLPGRRHGAVVVRSAAVGAGYIPDADPRLGDGCFRSRDLATMRGGELVLLGRADDLIVVKGRKVNPREVERVLVSLPGVDDAVVLGVPAPDGRSQVVRGIVACRSGELGYAAVRAHCRARLADYKVPRSLVLVAELPRDERGKLDRAALAGLPVGITEKGLA
jgi:acyl-coenzyme A synthetase/AMP-(fatty) acid ligase